ncbi:MAG: hypothetical protein PF503_16840 [Desulfobacula sp.]|jgi:hypothetical protein|nr:hypothetical protein [Desulfobacula sp.]
MFDLIKKIIGSDNGKAQTTDQDILAVSRFRRERTSTPPSNVGKPDFSLQEIHENILNTYRFVSG